MFRNTRTGTLALALAAGLATTVVAQTIHPEVEPNNTKAEGLGNGPFILGAGDGVSGVTTGATATGAGTANADYFVIRTLPNVPRIYVIDWC